ncbi:hypothetical protein HOY82DRAFT_592683 [Tuber indicum]|nr:hypothetical protein HOY82DRAFT_592683 [Tuber indicum]
MVSRVDPDTWLSTAEFFRASLPEDQLPDGRGGPDGLARYYREAHPPTQESHAPAWLRRRPLDPKVASKGGPAQKQGAGGGTIGRWDRRDTQPENSPQIVIGRRPLPPTVDAIAVCKTRRGDIEHRAWATYAEIRALNAIQTTIREEDGIDTSPIILHTQQPKRSRASDPRAGRSLRHWEKDKEGSLTEEQGVLSTTTNPNFAGTGVNGTYWEAGFNPPYPNNRAWVGAHLSREYTYWQAVINNNDLRPLLPVPMPEGFNAANWFGNFRTLQAAIQDPAVHTFRTEPFHVLTHNKLSPPDDSILMKGKKINCIVDWDRSGYLPISENIKDILKQYEGAGIADPDIWDEDAEPFSKCRYYGWSWSDWIENMRVNQWQVQSIWTRDHAVHTDVEDRIEFGDRFDWYGRITPNDLRYGDKYADQDIDEDDGRSSCSKFRITAPITRGGDANYDFDEGDVVTEEPDFEWWSAPVMHLVNDYVQTHLGYDPMWSWPDPVIEDWGRRFTNLGENLDPP